MGGVSKTITLIIFLLALAMPVFSYSDYGSYLECNSCSDCNNAINVADAGDEVRLTTDITNEASTCIDFNNTENIIFDCQDNTIDGVNSGYGIYEEGEYAAHTSNFTIQNCVINDFQYGINTQYADAVKLYNITISSASSGINIYIRTSDGFNELINIHSSQAAYGFNINYAINSIFRNIFKAATLTDR